MDASSAACQSTIALGGLARVAFVRYGKEGPDSGHALRRVRKLEEIPQYEAWLCRSSRELPRGE